MAEPLRILEIYPKEDYFTGAAIQLRELVLGLKARGHDVTVATRPSEIWVEKMRAASVPYVPLPMASELDLRSVKGLVRILRSRRVQVVHAQKGRARTLALIAGLFVRIPVLVLNRGVSFPLDPFNRLGYTTRRVTAVVAVCASIKAGLVRQGARLPLPRGRSPDPQGERRDGGRLVRRARPHRDAARVARRRHARHRHRPRGQPGARPPPADGTPREAARPGGPRRRAGRGRRRPRARPRDGTGGTRARRAAVFHPREARADGGALPATRRGAHRHVTLPLGPYRRLFVYLRPHVPVLVLGACLALVVSGMEGLTAWLVKPVMDDIFIRRDGFMLKLIPLALLAVYVVKGLAG